jgi:hypothetical protein
VSAFSCFNLLCASACEITHSERGRNAKLHERDSAAFRKAYSFFVHNKETMVIRALFSILLIVSSVHAVKQKIDQPIGKTPAVAESGRGHHVIVGSVTCATGVCGEINWPHERCGSISCESVMCESIKCDRTTTGKISTGAMSVSAIPCVSSEGRRKKYQSCPGYTCPGYE